MHNCKEEHEAIRRDIINAFDKTAGFEPRFPTPKPNLCRSFLEGMASIGEGFASLFGFRRK